MAGRPLAQHTPSPTCPPLRARSRWWRSPSSGWGGRGKRRPKAAG